jgi:four helix bundle protein
MYETGGFQRLFVSQLVNCSTSVASMLEEARGAESRRDFSSKVSIGLKEARESHVRLRICERSGLGSSEGVRPLEREANELVAILVTIVKNTRRKRIGNCELKIVKPLRASRKPRTRHPGRRLRRKGV